MGTSIAGMPKKTINEDHPHAYGDKKGQEDKQMAKVGSSPRVWGQVPKLTALQVQQIIIPTRMGTSNKLSNYIWSGEDHPHAYGDKVYAYSCW